MNSLSKKILTATIASIVLSGCNSTPPKHDPQFAPVRPVYMERTPASDGSIFQAGQEISWFEDMRARRVGDLLTVKLVEKTEGKKEANSDVSKSQSLDADVSLLESLGWVSEGIVGGTVSAERDFSGAGDADQKNELSGSVTVSVIEVLPNGNLYVRGEKRIGINQGNEYVKLAGIVRPIDIDSSNTVLSTKIGDATIMYVGDGQVADASKMGWLARFFISAIMPF
jgi:flagellar L-ring protein precursor FlgH